MRLIVEIKLKDNTIMNVVADAQNKESVRSMAAQLSPRLFADKKFFVYNNSPINKVEKWAQDKQVTYQPGFRRYAVAFMFNGGVQFLQIQAGGVKSAYNNIKRQYGINENLFMMIYEVVQTVTGKSLINFARQAWTDENRLREILKFGLGAAVDLPELVPYSSEIKLLVGLVKDYKAGEYKDISGVAVIAIVAVLVYIVNPTGWILDIIPGMGVADEVEIVMWLIKQLSDDIKKYSDWLTNGEEDMILV